MHLQVRVGHAADHLLTAEDAFCDLCRHQVYRVVLAHSGHGIAAVNAALPQGIRVGGVAHQSRAAKAVVVKGIQTLELFGILFDQRDIMADAFQIADEGSTHLVAADHQNIHMDSPRCRMVQQKYQGCLNSVLICG